MEDQDLREIGINDPQHRRKLLQAARSLPKVKIIIYVYIQKKVCFNISVMMGRKPQGIS